MKILPLNKWIPGLTHPLIMAGPCSAESESQVLQTAHQLAAMPSVRIFRAGIWKPRTRPNSFEGMGETALPWLQKVREQTNLLTATEVASAKHVELALKHHVDVLWIGARTTTSPFAVQEIADAVRGTNVAVFVKNPINPELALWMGALERINNAGITKMAAIHRGFSFYEKTKFRNPPVWSIPIELKHRIPQLPIITDPSHICGTREFLQEVSQHALDLDFEGVMLESHPNPENALSDAAQQVTPARLKEMIDSLLLRTSVSSDRQFEMELEHLRRQIDSIDNEIIDTLKNRMNIVEKIAAAKMKSKVTALQLGRMDEMMKNRMDTAAALGLSTEFIEEIYQVIHTASVKKQTDMMNNRQ
jgi:chorismate mutase